MRTKKWQFRIVVALMGVLVAATGVVLYGVHVWKQGDNTVRMRTSEAYKRVQQHMDVSHVQFVTRFVSDTAYDVLTATDVQGEMWTIWVWDEGIEAIPATKATDEKTIRSHVATLHPTGQLIRLVPGKIGAQYVWEAFVRIPPKGDRTMTAYVYEYFGYVDGVHVTTYRLAERP